jgi:hypothetical protein
MMLNWSLALGAWALGGPLWGVVTFLAVALLRVSIDAQALRYDNAELKRRLGLPRAMQVGADDPDEVPESEIRVSRNPSMATRAVSGA